MALTSAAQALFDHARNSLPRWVTSGKNSALEWLYAFGEIYEAVHIQATEYLAGIFLNTATGRWLDQHARDRDTTRRVDETDTVLRERLRQIEDSITDPALQAGINAIIGAQITITVGGTISFYDYTNAVEKILTLPVATYTHSEFLAIVRAALPAGWTAQIINGRLRFDAKYTVTGANALFDVVYSHPSIATDLGFTGDALTWNVTVSGYYESTTLLPGAVAINHLRRGRAHFQNPSVIAIDTQVSTGAASYYEFVFQSDGAGVGHWADNSPELIYHFEPGVTTIQDFENTLSDFIFLLALDISFVFGTVHPTYTIPAAEDDSSYQSTNGLTPVTIGRYYSPECTAFHGGGYRITNATRPMTYVIQLPTPATQATADAVAEYARQYGPAGYEAIVEVLLPPMV